MEVARSSSAPSLTYAYNLRRFSEERGRLTPEQTAPVVGASRVPARADAVEGARSRHAPSPPLAYNLRQYSVDRGRLLPNSSAAASKGSLPFSQVDLLGGNGRWRQKRAKEQWILDQAVAERQRRERLILEGEKKRTGEEREAMLRKQQKEDQQRKRAFEENKQRERLAQEERERQEEEERRLKAEREQAEWLASQPRRCPSCMGSGKCVHCGGRGVSFAMFLAPSVGSDTAVDFGRAEQGCPECGGCAQNVRADLRRGSGTCYTCDGVGMVTPEGVQTRRSSMFKKTVTSMRRMSGVCSVFQIPSQPSPSGVASRAPSTAAKGSGVTNVRRATATCRAVSGMQSLGRANSRKSIGVGS